MQLYAFDRNKQLISARQAVRHIDYHCPECSGLLRLRGGPQRQCHFYHLELPLFCRQHQKGDLHLQLQSYFLQELPVGDSRLEHSFPAIRRIADVAWISKKLVFEIQCSPIPSQEVLARNRDYQQLGWKVVWILHDQRYNQVRLSAAEVALRSSPHFFSNMDRSGRGIIYDQFDLCVHGVRRKRLPPLPIDVKALQLYSPSEVFSYPLALLQQRALTWDLSLMGDLMSLFVHTARSDYLSLAIEIEKQFYGSHLPLSWPYWLLKGWRMAVVTPYQIVFRFLLERMCR